MHTAPTLLLNEVNSYLMERFGYKRPPARSSPPGITICARKAKFDIYLRTGGILDLWPLKTLVIARIGFWKIRKGHGTDFLRFIVRLAHHNGYEHIGIENTNSESSAFAVCYGFTGVSGQEDKHYVTPIAELLRHPRMREMALSANV